MQKIRPRVILKRGTVTWRPYILAELSFYVSRSVKTKAFHEMQDTGCKPFRFVFIDGNRCAVYERPEP